MSTVRIKTEPAAEAAVDVQVKLELSLSSGDIKLEQHSSDIDTKVESDSEADSEEDDIKSESDDEDDTEDIERFTVTPKKQRQFICEHPGCGRSFNLVSGLRVHQRDHKLQAELNMSGKTYTLTRQSLSDRWSCPIRSCKLTYNSIKGVCKHLRITHDSILKRQQQQPPVKKTRSKLYFFGGDFYLGDVRCGYHNSIGVFICYECKLVPECLLTHLQQKHGYDEKSIDDSALPESAVNANANPNGNQHVSNPHLTAAISQPYRQHHPDIVRGWVCVTSDCGYCSYSSDNKSAHKKKMHQGEQISTIPALVLRLSSSKTQTSCFLITRIDQASGAVTTSSNKVNRHKPDYSHNGLNIQDENGDDIDQNEIAETSNQKQQWKCEHHNCGRLFNSIRQLYVHRREHKLEVETTVHGRTFTLSRQSLSDRWSCPVPDCDSTYKAIDVTRIHIQYAHRSLMKQKCNNTDNNNEQQEQRVIKRKHYTIQYLNVDDFYVSGTRCGYHAATGLFICHECRLVPEYLLTHLQQKHGFDEKSIDNSALPESAVTTNADPNINQRTSNSHLASAIREPNQRHHKDIVHGWLCVTSDCGYCCSTKIYTNKHQRREHKGEQLSTAPALLLQVLYSKARGMCFLITRLDAITTDKSVHSNNSTVQHNIVYEDDCDGDELVLSDYSDEEDIH